MRSNTVLLAALITLTSLVLRADDKKPDPKTEKPKIVLALPLGVPAGTPSKTVLRGLKLDTATEIHCSEPKAAVKLLTKGKAALPDKAEPAKLGDTQVEIELNVPTELGGKTVTLTAVTPAGDTEPFEILVDVPGSVVQEKEPNNSFRQAQPIQVPQVIEGAISQNQDVDVFRFEGKAAQVIVLDVLAARRGSALDSMLLFHDADGKLLGSNDDHDGSLDSYLEIKLPRDGAYFVTVMDAHDTGGPLHVYRLAAKVK
jgi:hypothetical protein